MTTPTPSYCFNEQMLDEALSRWPASATFKDAIRNFLRSEAAEKLRVRPSEPRGIA